MLKNTMAVEIIHWRNSKDLIGQKLKMLKIQNVSFLICVLRSKLKIYELLDYFIIEQ